MGKAPAKEKNPTLQTPPVTPQPGIKFTITGQVALKVDRKLELQKYQETFVIPERYQKEALSVVLRCLLPHRLAKKHNNFGHIRTHEISSRIQPVKDAGLSELCRTDLWDMDSEQIRLYALLVGIEIPEYRMVDGKKKLLRMLTPVEVIKNNPLDFDLKDKLVVFLQKPSKPTPVEPAVSELPEEDMTDEVSEAGPETKENWEKLD
mgnify:CR=1 FL=1